MRRSTLRVLLIVLLLAVGVVVGRWTSPSERPGGTSEVSPLMAVAHAEAAASSPAPTLAAREDAGARDRDMTAMRDALDALRAERDRLASELAKVQEQASRWDALAELERVQRAANETAAVAASRNVISALAQMQATAKIDEDRDGTGEFAGFMEMSGGAAGRIANGMKLMPPVLSGAFSTLTRHGEAYLNGYLYRIFLPDARGNGVGEGAEGFLPSQVDANLAETTWCMYAWPAVAGEGGQKTFFTNQAGDVLVTDDTRYAGPGNGPAADAAFRTAGITGLTAIGVAGNDGNVWKQVN